MQAVVSGAPPEHGAWGAFKWQVTQWPCVAVTVFETTIAPTSLARVRHWGGFPPDLSCLPASCVFACVRNGGRQ